MQLEQRNRSANEIDHGLALMASAYAAPGTQGQIMHSMDKDQPDPGTQLGNLIQLQYMQKMQGMPAPEGVPAAAWASSPPNVKMKLLEDAAQAGIQTQTKLTQDKQADLLEARQKAPAALQQMTQMDTIADQIKGAKAGDTPVLQGILSSPTKKAAAMYLMEPPHKEGESGIIDQVKLQAAAAALSPEEQAAVNQLKQLDNQIYGEAFNSTGSRRTQQEVQNLRNGISTLKNFNQSYEDYMKQFDNFQNQLHKSIGNTYGASQDLDSLPEKYRWGPDGQPLVEHNYLPGGNLYEGKGGDWVKNPPKQTGSSSSSAAPAWL